MASTPTEVRRLTLWQRLLLRSVRRKAKRADGEPLREEDWRILWEMETSTASRFVRRIWSALPGTQRCGVCTAPFAGPGSFIVKPLGYRPSRKNPMLCATCVEASPPGGITMPAGVLFADVRGYTELSETVAPSHVSSLLRRFYGCAERVLFPEAVIDKLIGDEVMALYLPPFTSRFTDKEAAPLMVAQARQLLAEVGYGTAQGPFLELGIGLDFGEAYVGNIGDRAVYDFTAVGDVVNTASRLQSQAAGGEILLSERIASGLTEPAGTPVTVELKGKGAQPAFRITLS